MNGLIKICCFIVVFNFIACGTKISSEGKEEQAPKESAQQISSQKMNEQGFSKGTITLGKSEGCPHILNVEEYKDNLDPINLKDFFKDGIPDKVWVKFASLRMPSRCTEARPVSIIEISKRSE
ncbi:hypothetical protein [Aquimarina sp. MMG016]|uniref:hypothetical protein n=1 Tax=Aquimarina sp. MMG016 TaxID=2822690 RepID=UPI001B3A3BFF|nr:hypothetical protein [Aquimarina sp. MMG016]MBQ4819973.1 hypothetical protein [Aquimarina sp. MMG016]